jgi:hypothetical protein
MNIEKGIPAVTSMFVCAHQFTHTIPFSMDKNHVFHLTSHHDSLHQTALASLLMTTGLGVSAKTVNSRYTSAGYDVYVGAYFDTGCSINYGNYFYASAYSAATKFRTTGRNGYIETSSYDQLYLSYSEEICDDTTVTYKYGNIGDFSDYGGTVPAKFTIDKLKLTEASIVGLELPLYSATCNYVCMEVCYPEIFEYGTCPEMESYLECSVMDCGVEEYIGTATVSVSLKTPAGTNTPPESSSSSYSFSYGGSSYRSRSKGSYRYDIPVTITAKLNGADLFSSTPTYYSQLSNTNTKDVSKWSSKL